MVHPRGESGHYCSPLQSALRTAWSAAVRLQQSVLRALRACKFEEFTKYAMMDTFKSNRIRLSPQSNVSWFIFAHYKVQSNIFDIYMKSTPHPLTSVLLTLWWCDDNLSELPSRLPISVVAHAPQYLPKLYCYTMSHNQIIPLLFILHDRLIKPRVG